MLVSAFKFVAVCAGLIAASTIVAMRRVRSAPQLQHIAEEGGDDSVGAARQLRPHSNGALAMSLTAHMALCVIRTTLLNTMISWDPIVEIEIWHGSLFAAIWWHPRGPRSIMRPAAWHTTLVKGYVGRLGFAPHRHELPRLNRLCNNVLAAMLAHLRTADGALNAWISLPPWWNSWCFGTPVGIGFVCEPLMLMIEASFLASDSSVTLRARREFHISWH
jgi:hypothetical protein